MKRVYGNFDINIFDRRNLCETPNGKDDNDEKFPKTNGSSIERRLCEKGEKL